MCDLKARVLEKRFIKVFGERNTGTRALLRMLGMQPEVSLRPVGAQAVLNLAENRVLREQIDLMFSGRIRRQYRDAVLDMEHAGECPTLAWKHAAPDWDAAFVAKQAHVVFCVRNPYSWVISLAKHPYHKHDRRLNSLEAFVGMPWLTMRRDNLGPILASPLALWNRKNAAYLAFMQAAEVPTGTMSFEGFVATPVVEVKRIPGQFAIPSNDVRAVEVSTKDNRSAAEISERYVREAWRDSLNADLVRSINAKINWEVAEAFGYKRLNPEDFPTSKNWFRSRSLTLHSGFQ